MNAISRIDELDQPMARGGRRKDRNGPGRRCIVTGVSGGTDRMIRFVLSPAGEVVPDIAGKLPGRGAWVTSDRASVQQAVKRKAFSRAFRKQVTVPEDLDTRLQEIATSIIRGSCNG